MVGYVRMYHICVLFFYISFFIDILEGDEKRILGLIWTLIEHFAVIMINAHLQTDIRSYSELKETLLLWARHKVSQERYGLEITNFTDSLSDGRVFLALLNDGK